MIKKIPYCVGGARPLPSPLSTPLAGIRYNVEPAVTTELWSVSSANSGKKWTPVSVYSPNILIHDWHDYSIGSWMQQIIPLGLVWESKYRRRLEGLKSSPYSILNKKGILTLPIPSSFVAPKLAFNLVRSTWRCPNSKNLILPSGFVKAFANCLSVPTWSTCTLPLLTHSRIYDTVCQCAYSSDDTLGSCLTPFSADLLPASEELEHLHFTTSTPLTSACWCCNIYSATQEDRQGYHPLLRRCRGH
jgi:hypothetical protein